ncbi:MAG TPA: hypothetical protein IAB55_06540 [Candidatus Merdivicinus faecavium]|nr:hypothetical protein [Candidatus Merdivicinus faecavium]
MKRTRKIIIATALSLLLAGLTSCTEASQVNYNINQAADNFNVTRRLEVINARTDTPLFELIGNFSLSNNSENELVITVELENGIYKKHYVYLNEYTMYVVEDLSGSDVSPYHYEINVLPEQFQVFELVYEP